MDAIRHINAEPKPGHEMPYWLAWKHRIAAGKLMLRYQNRICGGPYRRAYRIWSRAMDRIAEHGQDRIVPPPRPARGAE